MIELRHYYMYSRYLVYSIESQGESGNKTKHRAINSAHKTHPNLYCIIGIRLTEGG